MIAGRRPGIAVKFFLKIFIIFLVASFQNLSSLQKNEKVKIFCDVEKNHCCRASVTPNGICYYLFLQFARICQRGNSFLKLWYNISTESGDELIVPKPHVSIPVTGRTPIYPKVFTVRFPCTGKKEGLINLQFSLSYKDPATEHSPQRLKLIAKKFCRVSEQKNPKPPTKKTSAVKRSVIITVVVIVALLLCFSTCIGLYYCYYKKNQKLQIKFDAEYELASQTELNGVVEDHPGLQNHVYDEDDDAPKRPIFNPKVKQDKSKNWKDISRYSRSVIGNPVYLPCTSSLSSPDAFVRVLENIPEEIDADAEAEADDENRCMLKQKYRPEFQLETTSNGDATKRSLSKNKQRKRRRIPLKNSCEIILNDNVDESNDLYQVLNAHWAKQFHEYLFDINQISVDSRPFSKGAYGYIHKGKARAAYRHKKFVPVAVKVIKESVEFDTISSFVSEGLIMSRFEHRNILKLFGVILQPCSPPMMVMPYMKHGDLNQYLRNARATPRKPQLVSTRQLVNFGLQIAQGMEYLAGMRYVHRDLATRNCMVSEGLEIKISDFGLAKEIGHDNKYVTAKQIRLPIKWMAIESLKGVFSEKSDVWSFGVVLWELMTLGQQPYSDIESFKMEQHLKSGNRLSQPEICPEEIYAVMRLCWREDHSERPDFSELCSKITTFESKYSKYSLDYALTSSNCTT